VAEIKFFLLCALGELRVKILEIIMLLIGDLFYGNFVAKQQLSLTPWGEKFSIFSPCFDSKIQRFSFN